MSTLMALLFAGSLAMTAATAQAQGTPGFPNRPVKIIVPTPAGGASDSAARLLAQSLAASLGQAVVVENKPGASGMLAVQAVQAAPADGHTLLWTLSSMAGIPVLMKDAPVKSLGEFAPISQVVNISYGLFVHPSVPAQNLAELTAHARSQPDRVNYATGTLGEYMVAAHYLKTAGVKAVRVPYKGGAQLMPDLISGQVQFNFGPLYTGLPHVRTGKLRLLAVLPQRNGTAPDVPSLAEAGVPAGNTPTWNGLMAPPNTPRDITERISSEVAKALTSPTLRSTLEAQGLQVVGSTPQAMAEIVASTTTTWRNFVRDYDIPQE